MLAKSYASYQRVSGTPPPFTNEEQNNATNKNESGGDEQPWIAAGHSLFLQSHVPNAPGCELGPPSILVAELLRSR
jgi:hypothetical protein